MNKIDEILASYDPIDMKYESHFPIEQESIEEIIKQRYDSKYFSFIPTVEEVERIFLEPLKNIKE